MTISRATVSVASEQHNAIVVKNEGILKILGKQEQQSRLVNKVVRELNKIGKCSFIKVFTPKGDTKICDQLNILYNELFRHKGQSCVPETIGTNRIRTIGKQWTTKEWNKRWGMEPTCRQTKRFWPEINWSVSRELRLLERDALSKIVQLTMGHGFNKYHLRTKSEDMWCRFCKNCYKEDTWHIANECTSLDSIRRTAGGQVNSIIPRM